jgi:hypothetical protein
MLYGTRNRVATFDEGTYVCVAGSNMVKYCFFYNASNQDGILSYM